MKIMAYSIEQFPTPEQLENTAVYKKLVSAHRCLAELKGVCRSMPNQAILINLNATAQVSANCPAQSCATTKPAKPFICRRSIPTTSSA